MPAEDIAQDPRPRYAQGEGEVKVVQAALNDDDATELAKVAFGLHCTEDTTLKVKFADGTIITRLFPAGDTARRIRKVYATPEVPADKVYLIY